MKETKELVREIVDVTDLVKNCEIDLRMARAALVSARQSKSDVLELLPYRLHFNDEHSYEPGEWRFITEDLHYVLGGYGFTLLYRPAKDGAQWITRHEFPVAHLLKLLDTLGVEDVKRAKATVLVPLDYKEEPF